MSWGIIFGGLMVMLGFAAISLLITVASRN